MFLSDLSIKRPVFATVMMLSLLTLGAFSYKRLAIDQWPDVEIPVLSIVTLYPGASPESVEKEVSIPIEEAVNPIAGVKHVFSVSREGMSNVVVEFQLEVKINEASQEARAKVSAIRGDLPLEIEEPVIQKLDFAAMPIVSLAVRSPMLNERELTTLVEKRVQRRLENISGVGKVDLVGPSTREVNVEIDPVRIESLGLGVDEVIAGLRSENVNTPLGRLNNRGSEFPMRIAGKPDAVEQFNTMVVAERNGRPITLGEVALVRDGIEEQRSLALVNGIPAVALDIMKQSRANTVNVVEAVKAEAQRLEEELPAGTEIEVVRDMSVPIRESVRDVQETLLLGALLTVFIVFLFLNSWRSTVITGLTLPISVISSFIAMYFLGMTLNVLTLMALSLAIGLLIDDAIVVRENIVRHLEKGEDHFAAARGGTNEIGLAVLATTLSIVAVFLPVAFMKGIIGRFFFQFGITVAFAVLISLFVSFTMDPMLSSRWFDPDIQRIGRRHLLARILDRFNDGFDRVADQYRRAIGWALDHRRIVMGLAVAAFVGGCSIFGSLPQEFMSQPDRGEFLVNFVTAPDASIDETRNRMEAVLATLQELPEIDHTYATIGAGESQTVRDASVYVKLVDRDQRQRTQKEVQDDARLRVSRIPGILPAIVEAERMDMRKPLMVSIRGENLDQLKQYAARLKDRMYGIPGIVDIDMTLEHSIPEYRLVVDRERTMDTGLTTATIVRTVSALIGGQAVSTYEDEDGDAVDVRVRLPGSLRQDVSQVENLRVAVHRPGAEPSLVTVGNLVRYELSSTPSEINRQDLRREVVVSSNLDALPLGTAAERVQALIDGLEMPPGYSAVFIGESEDMKESFGYLWEALVLAIVFVYLILAAQFESFVDPLAIMLSLPLSIVGMAGMLLATGDTLNIMSQIGLIMLMGLVTKNAILLVDFTKTLRRRGLDRREALIQAGRIRLRPIVMTTSAMIFGMLPTAFAMGSGGEVRAPMGRAVIGGLITSTLLTLLVVPVVYTLLDDLVGWVRAGRRRRSEQALEQQAPRPVHPAPADGYGELPAPAPVGAPPSGPALGLIAGFLITGFLLSPASAAAVTNAPVAPAVAASPDSAALAAAVPGSAPIREEGSRVLNLDQALSLAAQQNLDIQKAMEYRRYVEGKYVEERAGALPHFTITGSGLRQHDESTKALFAGLYPDEADTLSGQIGLTQTLFTWGQVSAAIRAAKQGRAMAEAQLQTYRQAAARDVSAAFYNVLLAKELAALAALNLDVKKRHADEAHRKSEAGTATDYDVLAAEVAVDNAKPELIRFENRVRTARENLGFLLALKDRVPPDAEGSLQSEVSPYPEYEAALQQAWENRPELAEIQHRLKIAGELVRIANAGDKPRLDFQGAYGWKQVRLEEMNTDGQAWQAGLFLNFPVFDGLSSRGRVAQARSDSNSLLIEETRLRNAISVEVHSAVDDVRVAGEIVNALSGTVKQAEQLLSMADTGYELGVKTYLEVQDAQLKLIEAKGSLALAQRDYLVSLVTLERVKGTLELPVE